MGNSCSTTAADEEQRQSGRLSSSPSLVRDLDRVRDHLSAGYFSVDHDPVRRSSFDRVRSSESSAEGAKCEGGRGNSDEVRSCGQIY